MTTPANPDGLITWLRAQLDDDERVAREALHPDAISPGVWTTEHHNSEYHAEPNRCHIAEDRSGHYWSVAHEVFIPNAEHMARHDPARVLAEVDAKRLILDLHPHRRFATLPEEWPDHWKADVKQAFPGSARPYVGCEVDDFNSDYEVVEPGWWCQTVRLLALPFAARDGYRSEWAPA